MAGEGGGDDTDGLDGWGWDTDPVGGPALRQRVGECLHFITTGLEKKQKNKKQNLIGVSAHCQGDNDFVWRWPEASKESSGGRAGV